MRDVTLYLRGRDISLSRTLNKASREVSRFRSELKREDGVSAFVKNLDSADSRMGNLVQTALALGPALVPIGAAAVPAVAGLTAELAAAAGAAATAMLAFNGIGDGLKAVNDYHLEPTAKNFEKVRKALQELGPAGANFVMFLDDLRPKIDHLQNVARAGLFPGLEDGISHLLLRGPEVERIIGNIAGALGDIAAEGGEALSSDKFDGFFDYIEHEARPILMDMARTLGNVVEGLGNMLIGFDPLTDQFSHGLLDMSRDFAKWTRTLEDNEGFQSFVGYVERVGPEVVKTLGSLVVAIADIVKAAAPVGEATLPIIRALADTLAAIANSPAGPVLISAAAGVSAVSRAVALYNVANGSAMLSLLTGTASTGKHAGKGAGIAASAIGLLGDRSKTTGKHAADLDKTSREANGGMRVMAGGAAVLALSMTDVDDSVGLSNTAMGVAIGTMVGPWGAAIGGAIGGVMDLTSWNDNLEQSVDDVNDALKDTTNLVGAENAITGLRKEIQKSKDSLADFGSADFWFGNPLEALGDFGSTLGNLFTDGIDEATKKANEAEMELNELKLNLSALRVEVSKGRLPFTNNNDELSRMAVVAKRAGVNIKKIQPATPEWFRAVAAIRHYNREQDTVPGRAASVADALDLLEDPLYTNAEAADALEEALSGLFDPKLDAREALLDWRDGLIALRKQIRKTSGELDTQSEAGKANNRATIDAVRNLQDYAVAEGRRTGNMKRVTQILRDGRKAIIDQGVAAGVSRPKMQRFVDKLVDIDDVVREIKKRGDINIKTNAPGAPGTNKDLKATDGWVHSIKDRGDININTKAPGADGTNKDLKTTDGWVHTIQDRGKIDINTAAPGADKVRGQLQGVDKDIRGIDGKKVSIELSAKAKNVLNAADKVWNQLGFAHGGVVDYYANGGMRENHIAQIARPGAMRVWAEPETGGEAYIPLAPSKRPRSRAIANETVRRLGGDVQWNADGNITLDTRVNGHPRKDVRDIDQMFGRLATSLERGYGKAFSKMFENLQVGFHWPLPRRYGPSGTWGHYASGGSHPALDWPAPLGTPIFSTLPGRVSSVQHLSTSYGNHVRINHGHGLESISGHMATTAATQGQPVMPGNVIGYVDSTGNSTGNHLHLEFRRNGVPINYTSWLHGGGPMGIGAPIGNYDGDHSGLNRASPARAKAYARSIMGHWGWGPFQWPYWEDLGNRESGWRWNALNRSSGAYGIPQSLPASKMASAGADWRTNAGTQLDWMAGYIRERYGGPYGAIQWHNAHNWYGDGGIQLFDNGGIWKHGQLGLNLSGRDEFVANPTTTRYMADGGVIDGLNSGSSGDAKRLIEAFSLFVDWTRRNPDAINFPKYAGLGDRKQRRLDRAGDRFNLTAGMDPSRVREEFNSIIEPLREAFGKDADIVRDMKRFRARVVDVSKALERERNERSKLSDRLQATRRKSREYSRSVAGNFRNDPFAGGLDEFALQVRADRNDARTTRKALARAERKGLDGALYKQLAASGNTELIQQFAGLSRAEIRRYERLFAARNRAANRAGDQAAEHLFGKQIDRQTHALERQTRVVQRLNQRLNNIEDRIGDRVERGARRGTRDGQDNKKKRLGSFVKEARG